MTRLAVLSDLHANLAALTAVEADLAQRGADQVVVLGDLVGYLTRPGQVVRRVAEAGWPCISGNYDLAVLAGGARGADDFLKPGIGPIPREIYAWTCRRLAEPARRFLASLPRRLELALNGLRVLAVHGSPEEVRQYVFPDHPAADLERWLVEAGAQVLLMGHTHRPFVRRQVAGLVVNPGSVGKPKDGDPRASYALIDLDRRPRARIVRVAYDLEAEAARLAEVGLPPITIDRLRAGT